MLRDRVSSPIEYLQLVVHLVLSPPPVAARIEPTRAAARGPGPHEWPGCLSFCIDPLPPEARSEAASRFSIAATSSRPALAAASLPPLSQALRRLKTARGQQALQRLSAALATCGAFAAASEPEETELLDRGISFSPTHHIPWAEFLLAWHGTT